jgi:predicted nucleotidyltransferase
MQYNRGMDHVLSIPTAQVAEFCRRWSIRELAVFGSALCDRLAPASDVDLLVTFAPDVRWSLLDHIRMQTELSEMLGRPVDLVSRRAIERSANPLRKREILSAARSIYAA